MENDNAKKVIRDIVVISETKKGTIIKVNGTGGEVMEGINHLLLSLADSGSMSYGSLIQMLSLMEEDK